MKESCNHDIEEISSGGSDSNPLPVCKKCGKIIIITEKENWEELDELFAEYNISSEPPFEFRDKVKSFIKKLLEEKEREVYYLGITAEGKRELQREARQSLKEEIEEIIKLNKENWALGLTYMADANLDNPFKTAKGHLDIILKDFTVKLSEL